MNAAQLIREGLRVAKPSLVLRAGNATQPLVGVWGGRNIVPPPPGNWEHRLTVDCTWLAGHGFPLHGCLSLYQGGVLDFIAVLDEKSQLPSADVDGIPLYGREDLSIPPCEALDACGSDLARQWFANGGGSAIAAAYDEEYRRRCSLYDEEVFAVLGGWHALWPDSDDYQAQKGNLVLWTFHDAEPWVEVWLDESGSLRALPRIT